MSGSRLGRGRGGRLAVYGACSVVVVLLVFLYRAATTEMSRLRELHEQCVHQQEALAAQLQVIYEYKVRLEKSLSEEKSSNAAVKQELQQRASREKSLRDKDGVEAMQKFNSLQQTYKILQSEHQDLKDDCEKQQKQALEDRKILESTLRDLRTQIREAREDKEKSMEHLKTKHLELETEKERLEEKYEALIKSNGNTDSTINHLRKEIIQINRELKEAQNSCRATSQGPSMISEKLDHQLAEPNVENIAEAVSIDEQQRIRPSSQQQILQNVPTTSSRKFIPAAKIESSTKSGVNSASTISNKSANPVGAVKSAVKVKLPSGVLPILDIIDTNVETNGKLEETRKDDGDKNLPIKTNGNEENRDRSKFQANNRIPQVSGRRHMGEEILNGPDDAEWFRAKGIQEIGDDVGNDGKIQDFDDGQVKAGADGADYDNYYNKAPQQKNAEESEDEGEEDDVADYMNNNEMKKQE